MYMKLTLHIRSRCDVIPAADDVWGHPAAEPSGQDQTETQPPEHQKGSHCDSPPQAL